MDILEYFLALFLWDEDGHSHAENGNKMSGHDSPQIKADKLLVLEKNCIQDMVFLHASVCEQKLFP